MRTELSLEDKRQRITEVVSHGLVQGKGSPVPGELCLEAAICLALGLPHGDAPPCVAEPDREFAIGLSDTVVEVALGAYKEAP